MSREGDERYYNAMILLAKRLGMELGQFERWPSLATNAVEAAKEYVTRRDRLKLETYISVIEKPGMLKERLGKFSQ